jgi:asparagine synthase (glutamine-hydrolysing)
MCGIAGAYSFNRNGNLYKDKIKEAISCIRHRGPDGEGIFSNDVVALGHRRLSIIDISEVANQPMFSEDKRYCIIFNGEIFNYQELRDQYLKGYELRTHSDTEVFLNLFMLKGTQCFKMLRGFFAAAILDTVTNELFIVRDRYGKKPIHIYQDSDVLLFSSELKSIFSFGIKKQLNWEALTYYFQLNYIPSPLSSIHGVKKLEPGHFIKISANKVTNESYYQLETYNEMYGNLDYTEAKARLIQLMDESVKSRLISDVPLGCFLSGGIDSSVVVALASQHQRKLKTFSIGYKDHPFFDETYYAEQVAKRYGTDHTVFNISNNAFLENIEEVLNAIDEPFADSSSIPTYILSKLTRKHVTVALSGDGGDEVFAGYNKHSAELAMQAPGVRENLVKLLQPLWTLLPKSRNSKLTNKFRQLNRFAEGSRLNPMERYLQWASILKANDAGNLFNKHIKNQLQDQNHSLVEEVKYKITGKDFNEVLLADMNLVLVGDMLVKVDMMSMANSLEIRSPFLDQEVVDFAFSLPSEFKINKSIKKRIVQDAFRSYLPEELYNRPKKGFEIPLLNWLRNELTYLVDDLLGESFITNQGIFDYNEVVYYKSKLYSPNPGDSHATIWALIVFQYWWRKNLQ